MEPKELTSGILLESVLECTSFVVNEVPNLYSAVIESIIKQMEKSTNMRSMMTN